MTLACNVLIDNYICPVYPPPLDLVQSTMRDATSELVSLSLSQKVCSSVNGSQQEELQWRSYLILFFKPNSYSVIKFSCRHFTQTKKKRKIVRTIYIQTTATWRPNVRPKSHWAVQSRSPLPRLAEHQGCLNHPTARGKTPQPATGNRQCHRQSKPAVISQVITDCANYFFFLSIYCVIIFFLRMCTIYYLN